MGHIYQLGKLILSVFVMTTIISFTHKKQTMKDIKITYYYDALCGWCYGFSPVFKQIHETYDAQINFEVVSGGLFLGERVGPINEIAPYIKQGAYKTVESRTGVKFGADFIEKALNQGNMVMNSLYPAIALCIVKEEYPNQSIAFASLLHQAFYVDGMDSENVEGYASYVIKLGLSIKDFNKKMNDPIYKQKALEEFNRSNQQGIGGFPALIIEANGNRQILSNGYVDYEVLKQKIEVVLAK